MLGIMTLRFPLVIAAVAIGSLAVSHAFVRAPQATPLVLSDLKLPAGFRIDVYAEGLPSARQIAVGAKGTVFVGSRTARNVYALVDRNRDHKADEVKVMRGRAARSSAGPCRARRSARSARR